MKKLLFLIPILLFGFYNAYATLTLQNTDFALTDSNINVTSAVTVDSILIEPDGITTRFSSSDELRKYSFDNASSVYDVRFDSISSTKAQFTILDVITDARGNVTGTELSDIELDDVSVSWTFGGAVNVVSIDEADKVEYIFTLTTTPSFNAIILSLNSPTIERLGGVYAVTCPANHTLTGLLTNGSFICTNMDDFFP